MQGSLSQRHLNFILSETGNVIFGGRGGWFRERMNMICFMLRFFFLFPYLKSVFFYVQKFLILVAVWKTYEEMGSKSWNQKNKLGNYRVGRTSSGIGPEAWRSKRNQKGPVPFPTDPIFYRGQAVLSDFAGIDCHMPSKQWEGQRKYVQASIFLRRL